MRNDDALWYKDAIIYELHVRSFYDQSGDGVGDFRGLREKLPYFEDLGVTALWLLPFYPSPLKDDGYDIADYFSVHPSYGTLKDFQDFLNEAHKRGLRVITELVINHTSDQNAWFQRARRAPRGSNERDFYVWSDSPHRFEDARIIFKDFENSNWAWDPIAQAYYWHRFYSHQPDLNFDNPSVQEAIFKVVDFWLEMGVDGLRLDAVPYLFEREGTSCENLPETHEYLRKLRKHVDEKYPNRMLLAEANQWPEDAAAYFGKGDECHMEFHFPLMPRLFMALQAEDRFPIIDILDQTPSIPSTCQWALFLRNHDELTLEMVTDEERDYMVRIYAQDARARINLGIRRRLAPLLGNNRRKIEMINSLLLSLPGTPIIYYGDEIGMGDNFYLGDRNGVRTPMQWSADRNAGFSRANPQQLFLPVIIDPESHYEAVNVDMQQKNLSSLFWWMRRILAVRQRHEAFSRGNLEFLLSDNAKVLSYLREYEGNTLLIIANLSRFSQAVSLDLSRFKGHTPEELFGRTTFPEITENPYLFTVGPHGFYWFRIVPVTSKTSDHTIEIPALSLPARWDDELMHELEQKILPRYLPQCRWFGAKNRLLRELTISARFTSSNVTHASILLIDLSFSDGSSLSQALPLWIGSEEAGGFAFPPAAVARFSTGEVLWDALYVPEFRHRLFQFVVNGERWTDGSLWIEGRTFDMPPTNQSSRIFGEEQSNTSIVYDDHVVMKFFRRFESGSHPDAEILRALGEVGFQHVPHYRGEICCSYQTGEGTLGLITSFVPNQGDGWTYSLDAVGRFFDRVLTAPHKEKNHDFLRELIGGNYPERARQLGLRTGELHSSLEKVQHPAFIPEPFTELYQRSLYQALRSNVRRVQLELQSKLSSFPEHLIDNVQQWINHEADLLAVYARLLKKKIIATKMRVHGDYHLGQVLNTGRDFVILDFEGEPRRSLGERLLKRSPLVDVAGMLRSFEYVSRAALLLQRPEDQLHLESWAEQWVNFISERFLQGYLFATAGSSFLPRQREDFDFLLRLFQLDKAIYEIGYELSYRPHYLSIPLGAIQRLLSGCYEWSSVNLKNDRNDMI